MLPTMRVPSCADCTPEPAFVDPDAVSGGQVAEQLQVQVLVVAVSWVLRYSVIPLESTRTVPRLVCPVATVAEPPVTGEPVAENVLLVGTPPPAELVVVGLLLQAASASVST